MPTVSLNPYALLLKYLKPYRIRLVVLGLLLVSATALSLAGPAVVARFIDAASAKKPLDLLIHLALSYFGIIVIAQLASNIETYVAEDLSWRTTNTLRLELASHCLRCGMRFHHKHSAGEMIERIDGDVGKLGNLLSRLVVSVITNIILITAILVILSCIDWHFGFAAIGYAVCCLLLLNRISRLAISHWKANQQANADLFGFLEERITGAQDIHTNGAIAHTLSKQFRLMRELLLTSYRACQINGMHFAVTQIYSRGGLLGFGVAGVYLLHQHSITIGTIYLIFSYVGMMLGPALSIANEIQSLQQSNASIIRIQELFNEPIAVQDGSGVSFPSGPLSVDFEQVKFQYDVDTLVLHDLSFHLSPGKVLGLLGHTGSGKTTIARLLVRLYDLTSGRVCVGGVDIQQAHLADLRKRIGMVTQEVRLFHASVRDNITLFDPNITDEQIMNVIGSLSLGSWFMSLPQGLDTTLNAAESLSAGQAQLLNLTRVFLKDPAIVVLDEPSSRLDRATEEIVHRALDRLLAGRTAIIIAHSLATIERADEIIILENGRIIEQGGREQLANDPSTHLYQMLCVAEGTYT